MSTVDPKSRTTIFRSTSFEKLVYRKGDMPKIRTYLFMRSEDKAENKKNTELAQAAIVQAKEKGRALTFKLEGLEEQLRTKPYLIRNGNTLSLASCPANKSRNIQLVNFIDFYFSHEVLRQPVKCTGGYYFEKERLELWLEAKKQGCPSGKHDDCKFTNEDLKEDTVHKEKIGKYMSSARDRLAQSIEACRRLTADLEKTKTENIVMKRTMAEKDLSVIQTEFSAKISKHDESKKELKGEISREQYASRAGIGQMVVKAASLVLTQTWAEWFVKRVPILSFGVGLIRCGVRFSTAKSPSDYGVALGEVVSGVAGFVPGAGTAVSLVVDGLLLLNSRSTITKKKVEIAQLEAQHGKDAKQMELKKAYATLGLKLEDNPGKEEVDSAFRKMSLVVHSDRNSPEAARLFGELTNALIEARDIIYKHKGW